MRKADPRKEEKILKSIKRHREGTYVSEIARDTGITKSTVSWLLSNRLKKRVEVTKIGKKGFLKIIKLKK